jgi:hypothetical protein
MYGKYPLNEAKLNIATTEVEINGKKVLIPKGVTIDLLKTPLSSL